MYNYFNDCMTNHLNDEMYIYNMHQMSKYNNNFRKVIWSGDYMETCIMCINPGDSLGIEMHEHTDQIVYILDGYGMYTFGDKEDTMNYKSPICAGHIVTIPACKWHNLINTSNMPMKCYFTYIKKH